MIGLRRVTQMARRTIQMVRLYENWQEAIRNRFIGRNAVGLVEYRLRHGPVLTMAAGHEDVAIINDVWIDRPYEAPNLIPRPGWTVVDIGSNKGSFSARVAHLTDRKLRRLVCVEPEPENFACLERNVPDDSAQDVHLINAAVSSEPGVAVLYRVKGSSGQNSLNAERASSQGELAPSVPVERITLNEVLSYCPEGVDLLKLDCEGAEYDIVLNSPDESFKTISRLTMEYDDSNPNDHGQGVRALVCRLESLGYTTQLRSAGQASGLILDAVKPMG